MQEIKGLIFDYGGTLDSNGQHWAAVIWNSYKKTNIEISREQFNEAYVYAERKMALQPIILPNYSFLQVLKAKVTAQFEYLKTQNIDLNQNWINLIAEDGYTVAKRNTRISKPILENLNTKYPIVMVSNFYGNLTAVLRDFEIDHHFSDIVESAVVGIRKPAPAIYALGVKKINLKPENCLVIGDSYAKDMIPAKQCGCQTLWLKGEGWNDEENINNEHADRIFYDINDLEAIIGNWLANK
ncbi:HAD family hydrolase [Sphingobacterium sp. UT-1RO-CII-1]|uniref:HAD family hydrolase n=1 Tax=Sphingobacterium sp. UT-1RO-CII-1 TaxID=2995225 RepID=UPI00227BB2E8|nr:HAD family hydrolase [Sphingobacterium sp. UT-1RO-CII-1]MCY4779023.1 HAD family hydrolase [Sphingobacterium sp. UT-1RO-CII-1]